MPTMETCNFGGLDDLRTVLLHKKCNKLLHCYTVTTVLRPTGQFRNATAAASGLNPDSLKASKRPDFRQNSVDGRRVDGPATAREQFSAHDVAAEMSKLNSHGDQDLLTLSSTVGANGQWFSIKESSKVAAACR